MTPDQKAATDRANATIAPAHELYKERNKLAILYYRLRLPDLKRVNSILSRLTDHDLREVMAHAESLADWNDPPPQWADDQGISKGSAPAAPAQESRSDSSSGR